MQTISSIETVDAQGYIHFQLKKSSWRQSKNYWEYWGLTPFFYLGGLLIALPLKFK